MNNDEPIPRFCKNCGDSLLSDDSDLCLDCEYGDVDKDD